VTSELDLSDHSSSRIIRFSTFELNLHTGELRQQGQKVKLQEQPLQVLAALLERPGELVTREELHRRLWPADTFVDFDHSLNAAIKRLRDALGESADAPVFIETLARRGYRFIAPVNGSSASGVIEATPAPKRSQSLFWTHRIATAVFSLIVIAVLLWAAWRLPSRPTEVVERKLTASLSENSVTSAAVSPDGKYPRLRRRYRHLLKADSHRRDPFRAFAGKLLGPCRRLVSGRISFARYPPGTAAQTKFVEYFDLRRLAPSDRK